MIYKETRRIIDKYDFSVLKKYGQNFLIDGEVLEAITEASEIEKEDVVLEIGPGIGALTEFLAKAAGKVIAVEIDDKLIPILRDGLSLYENVEIIHSDIMEVDLPELLKEYEGKRIKVVANLPYYITTPVIMMLLTGDVKFSSIFLMVQKEVAERLVAESGTSQYGAVTLAASYYADCNIVGTVPPSCFFPRPGVDSALIKLDCYEKKPIEVKDEKHMFSLIRASFNQRRKTLANGIKNFSGFDYSSDEIKTALEKSDLKPDIRGEKLSLTDFAKLSDELLLLREQ